MPRDLLARAPVDLLAAPSAPRDLLAAAPSAPTDPSRPFPHETTAEISNVPTGPVAALKRIPSAIKERFHEARAIEIPGHPLVENAVRGAGVLLSPATGFAQAVGAEPARRTAEDLGASQYLAKGLGDVAAVAADPVSYVGLGIYSKLARKAIPLKAKVPTPGPEAPPTPAPEATRPEAPVAKTKPVDPLNQLDPRPESADAFSALESAKPDLLSKNLAKEQHQKIVNLAKPFFKKNPDLFEPGLTNADNILTQYLKGNLPKETFEREGINTADILVGFRQSIRESAQRMAYHAQLMRAAKFSPEEAARLKEAGLPVEDEQMAASKWRRATGVWKGLLVSQLATAARNAASSAARFGVHALETPIDAAIQKIAGRPRTTNPLDGVETLFSIFRKNKDIVEKILVRQPALKDKLLSRYASDLAKHDPKVFGEKAAEGVLGKADKAVEGVLGFAEKAVDIMNWHNALQDRVMRRAVFRAALDQSLRRTGTALAEGKPSLFDLDEVVTSGRIGDIPQEALEKATQKALDFTFSADPKTRFGKDFVTFMNYPIFALAVPFPRFMANAMRFGYEHSPLGLMSIVKTPVRDAIAAGKTDVISKAIVGSTMLYTAFELRDSKNAGEKWHEVVDDSGKVYDVKASAGPFAPYLFLADAFKRLQEGTLNALSAKEFLQAMTGAQFRAEVAMYGLDKYFDSLSGLKGADRQFSTFVKDLAGDVVGGAATPLTQLRDLYAHWHEEAALRREQRIDPLLDPAKSRIPGLSETLPEKELLTRGGQREAFPLTRQLTGVTALGPKNAFEKEADRLGFTERDLFGQYAKDTRVNIAIAREMGLLAEKKLVPFVQTERYRAMTNAEKRYAITNILKPIRAAARTIAYRQLTQEQIKELRYLRQPEAKRAAIESRQRAGLGIAQPGA